MSDFITGFVGFILGAVFIIVISSDRIRDGDRVDKAKEACEASLPRDQQCVMHFKPEAK